MYRCIGRMVLDPRIQDEIHSKLLQFNESMGSFGMSMAIQGRSKDPPGKNFQSFQIILSIVKNELNFQSHLLETCLHSTLIAAYWWGQFGGSCIDLKFFAV